MTVIYKFCFVCSSILLYHHLLTTNTVATVQFLLWFEMLCGGNLTRVLS